MSFQKRKRRAQARWSSRIGRGLGFSALALCGFAAAVAVPVALAAGGSTTTTPASGNAATHVTICHATGSPDTAGNGYVRISPSASGVYHGHYRQHAADIIPPFTYKGQTYQLNWDDQGQAIWNNGCNAPSSTGGTTTGGTTTSTTTTSTTTTSAASQPGLAFTKLQRIGTSGRFTHGTITGTVGDVVFYLMIARNTGNTELSVTLSDSQCDAGTEAALYPAGATVSQPVTLAPGAHATYTCSHTLASGDVPSFGNTATLVASVPGGGTVNAVSRVSAIVHAGVAAAQKTKVNKVKKTAHAPKRAAVLAASFTG